VQLDRPEARVGEVGAEQLVAYQEALRTLTAHPLADWPNQLLLVQDLVALCEAEDEWQAREVAESALRTALVHCVEGVLLRAVEDRNPQYVETRLCAMQQIRSLGGPATVALLLAVMSATAEQLARYEPLFDPDPLVQLRLVHLCGQLRGELAATEVRLPGRDSWQAIAPREFLAKAVLTEQAYYSPLRVPAVAALALSLGQPGLDADIEWVRTWYREQRQAP
jgi:hypothetical protein